MPIAPVVVYGAENKATLWPHFSEHTIPVMGMLFWMFKLVPLRYRVSS